MPYKLLALDLDYTLLNNDLKISPANKDAVARAVQEGMLVTLATGRMYRSTLVYARELQLDLPLVTYHGALVKKASCKEAICHWTVPRPLALEVLAFAREEGYHINLYLEDQLFVEKENENTRYYQTIADVKITLVDSLEDFVNNAAAEPTKVTFLCRDERFTKMAKTLQELYGSRLSILQSRPHFLELTHKEATKGKALETLGQLYGIKKEEMAAVGDSQNDVDMLKYAGMGVAVANAGEEVKHAADIITLSNEEDGVAHFILEHLLKRGN